MEERNQESGERVKQKKEELAQEIEKGESEKEEECQENQEMEDRDTDEQRDEENTEGGQGQDQEAEKGREEHEEVDQENDGGGKENKGQSPENQDQGEEKCKDCSQENGQLLLKVIDEEPGEKREEGVTGNEKLGKEKKEQSQDNAKLQGNKNEADHSKQEEKRQDQSCNVNQKPDNEHRERGSDDGEHGSQDKERCSEDEEGCSEERSSESEEESSEDEEQYSEDEDMVVDYEEQISEDEERGLEPNDQVKRNGDDETASSDGMDSRVARHISFDGGCPGYVINQALCDFRNEASKTKRANKRASAFSKVEGMDELQSTCISALKLLKFLDKHDHASQCREQFVRKVFATLSDKTYQQLQEEAAKEMDKNSGLSLRCEVIKGRILKKGSKGKGGVGEVYIRLGIVPQTEYLEEQKYHERCLSTMGPMVEEIFSTTATSSLTWCKAFELEIPCGLNGCLFLEVRRKSDGSKTSKAKAFKGVV